MLHQIAQPLRNTSLGFRIALRLRKTLPVQPLVKIALSPIFLRPHLKMSPNCCQVEKHDLRSNPVGRIKGAIDDRPWED
jgi:hypothetical protein